MIWYLVVALISASSSLHASARICTCLCLPIYLSLYIYIFISLSLYLDLSLSTSIYPPATRSRWSLASAMQLETDGACTLFVVLAVTFIRVTVGNFTSQDFDSSAQFLRGFVVSANIRNTCWSFYTGKLQSPQISAILRKTSTTTCRNKSNPCSRNFLCYCGSSFSLALVHPPHLSMQSPDTTYGIHA